MMMEELRKPWHLLDIHDISISLLDAGTYRNYDSGMRTFATFCEQDGLRPLQATTGTIVRHTAWLGLHGSVGAESLQQYYYSINKYFRNHQRREIFSGHPRRFGARRGLAIQHERFEEEDARVALPAPVAADILDTAIELRRTLDLRKGAALAASCIGVPLPAIKHMGDWSKDNEVVTWKYIDPTMRPTPAAWRFFGWLVPIQPLH
eukprot:jgi/Tetstr1/421410/TSEL_001177.t1